MDAGIPRGLYNRQMAVVIAVVSDLQKRGLLKTIDPQDILCDAARCRLSDRGLPLYRDASHLSKAGARMAVTAFEPVLKALEPKAPARSPHS
jgi:hypothetical protein